MKKRKKVVMFREFRRLGKRRRSERGADRKRTREGRRNKQRKLVRDTWLVFQN